MPWTAYYFPFSISGWSVETASDSHVIVTGGLGLCQGTWPYASNPRWGWGGRHLTLWQVILWHMDWSCKLLPLIMGIANAFTVMQDPRDQMELNTADFLTSRGRRYSRTQLPGAGVWLPKTIIPSLWLPAIGNVEESILNRDWTQPCNMHSLRVLCFFVVFFFFIEICFEVKSTRGLGLHMKSWNMHTTVSR